MVFDREIISKSTAQTAAVGQELAQILLRKAEEGSRPTSLCLYGELGSGKTTFVQGIARGLGITSRLLSPTFIIVRRYHLPQHPGFLYHLDLYRIKSEADLESLGLTEIFGSVESLVVIEWAEKLGRLKPRSRLDITFKVNERNEHVIKIKEN